MSKKATCPLLKKPCIEHGCKFWMHITGTHPQSGAKIDSFDCSIAWLPVLLVEATRVTTGVQASVESMRNEVVKRQDTLNTAVALGQREISKRIEDQDGQPKLTQ